jgi:hypothetical protein
VLREAEAYTDRKIPATAMWVDRPYSKGDAGWSEITWDDRFADPGRWISTMHDDYNIKVTTWIGLYNGGDSDCEMCVTNNNRYDWTDANFKSWFEQKLKENQYHPGNALEFSRPAQMGLRRPEATGPSFPKAVSTEGTKDLSGGFSSACGAATSGSTAEKTTSTDRRKWSISIGISPSSA